MISGAQIRGNGTVNEDNSNEMEMRDQNYEMLSNQLLQDLTNVHMGDD